MTPQKLATKKIRYKCVDDCDSNGCPTHKGVLDYASVSETFSVQFGDKKIMLTHVEMEILASWVKELYFSRS